MASGESPRRSSKKPGRGVVSGDLGKITREAADDLFAKCDAVVIVCVRSSGSNDTDEQVFTSRRGSGLHLSGALEKAYEADTSRVTVEIDEGDDEEPDDE